eukprot:9522688-Lingulodinium_polyedra.AAC.2
MRLRAQRHGAQGCRRGTACLGPRRRGVGGTPWLGTRGCGHEEQRHVLCAACCASSRPGHPVDLLAALG